MTLWTDQQRETHRKRRARRIEQLDRRYRFYTRRYSQWQETTFETWHAVGRSLTDIIRAFGGDGLIDGVVRKAVRR